MRAIALTLLAIPLLFACDKAETVTTTAVTGNAPHTADNQHPDIDKDEFLEHIQTLSSDEFEGRAPASLGEEKTLNYLVEQFKAAGTEPGNNGSWFQDVPLVTMTATPDPNLSIVADDGSSFELAMIEDVVVWTKRVTEQSAIKDSEMVFVGYGIVAPEYNWNDYANVDVRGKTVVMLVNDPGYATGNDKLFNGNAMTYYGRWTYKYEEAARQGAAGVLIIHETAPAAYPWSVVQGSWTGPQHDLVTADKNAGRSAIEGWITDAKADVLLKAAGSSYAMAKEAALDPSKSGMPMNMRASVSLTNSISVADSKNVLAKITGTKRPDEHILYMGHWDHLGKDDGKEGDNIYNGAVDNATGTAGLIMLAKAFKAQEVAPERSIIFVAVTAEESGLLGSRHYANNPPVPLAKTVAGINMDALNAYGATRNVSVIGYGSSELEKYLAEAASKQQRSIGPEPTPEKGYFYRSDHFNLAKKGVPVLYAKGGIDFVNGGVEAGRKAQANYTTNDYHKPSDEINDQWDLTGAAEDLQLFLYIGQKIAGETTMPNWYKGNEFRSIRDASLKEYQMAN